MMRARVALILILAGVAACASALGGVRDIDMPTVAVRAADGASAADVAAVIRSRQARVALVAGPPDSTWFADLAGAAGLTLSGPATDGIGLGFLGPEPLGDSTVVLRYEGGTLTLHDALYEPENDRFLDLLAFRVEDSRTLGPAMGALLRYIASDVMNQAAVAMAVAVPTAAVGDSVARMLSPAFFDALRCEPGLSPPEARSGIRLFYGPEARVYCTAASTADPAAGDLVRASLILGRR